MAGDAFGARSTLAVGGESYEIFRLAPLQERFDVERLPYTLKILLENVLRTSTEEHVQAVAEWVAKDDPSREISFTPARVIHQDFTGVPAIVDLAAMRHAMHDLGGDAAKTNPQLPVDLVIDHSVQVDVFGNRKAISVNTEREYERNHERYAFLRWAQQAFNGFNVVPPETGIVHQVNLEHLRRVVEEGNGGLPGHVARHRFAHDDDQRARRPGLGRRRDRGGGRDARPAPPDARPAGRRLPVQRRACARA